MQRGSRGRGSIPSPTSAARSAGCARNQMQQAPPAVEITVPHGPVYGLPNAMTVPISQSSVKVESLPGTRTRSPTAIVSSFISYVGSKGIPLSLTTIRFMVPVLPVGLACRVRAWREGEFAGVGEAEAGVAGCALGQ